MSKIIAAALFFSCVFQAAASSYNEEQKIAMLIDHLRELKGAVFIRNGREYSEKDAAAHLEMKYKKAGARIKTARQFIDHIASRSYFSGKDYMIKMPDGRMLKLKDVLNNKLNEIESRKIK